MSDRLTIQLRQYVEADSTPIALAEVHALAVAGVGGGGARRRGSRHGLLVIGTAVVLVVAAIVAVVAEPGSKRTGRIGTPTETSTTTIVPTPTTPEVAPLILDGSDVTLTRINAGTSTRPDRFQVWHQVFRRPGDSLAGPVLVLSDSRAVAGAPPPDGSVVPTPAGPSTFFDDLDTVDLGGGRRAAVVSWGTDSWNVHLDLGDGWARAGMWARGLSKDDLIATARQLRFRTGVGLDLPVPPAGLRQVGEGVLTPAGSRTVILGYLVGTATPTPENEVVLAHSSGTPIVVDATAIPICGTDWTSSVRDVVIRGHAALLQVCVPSAVLPPGESASTRSTLTWLEGATTMQLNGSMPGDALLAVAAKLRSDPDAFTAFLDRLGNREVCYVNDDPRNPEPC